jgi:tripartite-type tricarboxylate transporter receptor subunit TctC
MKRLLLLAALVLAEGFRATGPANAQAYPSRPIRIVVPSGPGGDLDRLGRGLATYMSKELGQPILVDDRPGGGNMIGLKFFLQQPADGYTFLLTASYPYIATNIYLMKAGFTLDDFDFINSLWEDSTAIYVNKDKPWKTLPALIDAIKANPGEISASVTYTSAGQIGLLALEDALKLPLTSVRMVTFDSGGDTRNAVIGGSVDITSFQVDGMATAGDRVVPLGIFENTPTAGFQGPTVNDSLKAYNASVPTIKGSIRTFIGHPEFKKNFPDRYEIVVSALKRTIERPDFQDFIKSQAMQASWRGPDISKSEIYENTAVWEKYLYLLKPPTPEPNAKN